MALWNKLQTELDRFGRVAQSAFDEGKARLEIMRVRQLADRAAQALGYAVYNARKGGGELEEESYARLSSTLAAHEAEAQRLEAQLEAAKSARADATAEGGMGPASGAAGATGSDAGTPTGGVDPAMGDTGAAGAGSTPGGSSSTGSGSHGTVNPPYSGPSGGASGY